MAEIKALYDKTTQTLTYVVFDHTTKDAVIIDPVLDYDPKASTYSFEQIEKVMEFVTETRLKVHFIMETHAHADHLSGSQELKARLPGAQIVIGENIRMVQDVFKGFFNLGSWFCPDGSQFDRLLKEGETLRAGTLEFKVFFTPGHTPACSSYLVGDSLFTGDALFNPDNGTGRCDFPKGDAATLYHSVHDVMYSLPASVKVYPGHDYPDGRDVKFGSPLSEQKQKNIRLRQSTSKEDFVKEREARDKTLAAPKLLLPSVQFNINAGKLAPPDDNGTIYLKIPLRKKEAK